MRSSPCVTLTSTSATMRTSESSSVTSVMISASARRSLAAATGAAVAHRPPHFRRRAGIERRFDDGAAVGDGAARDQARRQADVRLLARHIDRGPRGAGLRHRQHERRRGPA